MFHIFALAFIGAVYLLLKCLALYFAQTRNNYCNVFHWMCSKLCQKRKNYDVLAVFRIHLWLYYCLFGKLCLWMIDYNCVHLISAGTLTVTQHTVWMHKFSKENAKFGCIVSLSRVWMMLICNLKMKHLNDFTSPFLYKS